METFSKDRYLAMVQEQMQSSRIGANLLQDVSSKMLMEEDRDFLDVSMTSAMADVAYAKENALRWERLYEWMRDNLPQNLKR